MTKRTLVSPYVRTHLCGCRGHPGLAYTLYVTVCTARVATAISLSGTSNSPTEASILAGQVRLWVSGPARHFLWVHVRPRSVAVLRQGSQRVPLADATPGGNAVSSGDPAPAVASDSSPIRDTVSSPRPSPRSSRLYPRTGADEPQPLTEIFPPLRCPRYISPPACVYRID